MQWRLNHWALWRRLYLRQFRTTSSHRRLFTQCHATPAVPAKTMAAAECMHSAAVTAVLCHDPALLYIHSLLSCFFAVQVCILTTCCMHLQHAFQRHCF